MSIILLMYALLSGLGAAHDDSVKVLIKNAGFESERVAEGWEVVSYGAKAEVALDKEIVHAGLSSLRISSQAPADTALGQDISLEPLHWYRFQGWVRTRGLDPGGAPVCGTYQIQGEQGQGVLAAGASHPGDTEWTRVALVFQTPIEGRVRIAPFLVGFGKGKGVAWFDDLTIEALDPSRSTITITRKALAQEPIDRGQYGQFIEYLCDLVPSMWADKLCDGGFEGLSPYKFVYLKETDFKERPWHPIGATNRARYVRNATTKVSGEASLEIAAEEKVPCTVGVAQDGVAVTKGIACEFSCDLKQRDLKGPVRVRLHHEGTTYASCEFHPTAEWRKFHARLMPIATDPNATLSIEFGGPAAVWLDNAGLMPEDAVNGWRSDVVAAVRALGPGVIRFGGSALDDASLGDFEWRDTIGNPDQRKPFRAWGGLQPAAAGLEEIVQFCRLVDAEPLICVRIRERTPNDAAEQVAYFNGAINTPMGSLRARNGHAEPYRIRYWQVGNEQGGPNYESRLPEFCRAMKHADPSIQILSSYPSPTLIRTAREWIDFVAPHHYDCANLAAADANFEAIRLMIEKNAPERKIKIAVTEWNTTAGDAGPRRARLWTLENALACSRYHNLLHRRSDLVAIANRSNLINSFCSGCIQTDPARLYKTPTYYAQSLYASLAGDRPLEIDSPLPAQVAPDISATLSAKRDFVVLFAVNDGLAAVTRPLDFSAYGHSGRPIEVWTLGDTRKAGEPDATNSFGDPERVAPTRSEFQAASSRFDYAFPPLSLTVLKWRVEQ